MNLVNNDLPFWSPVKVNLPKNATLIDKALTIIGFRIDSCLYLGSRQIQLYLPNTNKSGISINSHKAAEIIEIKQGFFTITFKISFYALLAFMVLGDNSLNCKALALTPLILKAIYKCGYAEPLYIGLGEKLDFDKKSGNQSRRSSSAHLIKEMAFPNYFQDSKSNEASLSTSTTYPKSFACASGESSPKLQTPLFSLGEEKTQD